MLDQQLEIKLSDGITKLGLNANSGQIDKLIAYLHLIQKWNKVYNLTTISEFEAIVQDHLLDSLAIVPDLLKLTGDRIIDVGSGAGLPGIPVAILCPQKQVTLLDSRNKKARFLQQVKIELELSNIDVVCERVENHTPQVLFDMVLTRAFASLSTMLASTQHVCAKKGLFLAMKGTYPTEELNQLPPDYSVKQLYRLSVPQQNRQRHLIILENHCTLGS